ncbi:hypothetical protein XMIN_4168 [Xanthomonas citri pv. mangiferaeindicae LMG 941]|nr:hypothetical protein XMIN_4168 [Xanthomonas citri pv. mangiferaeindicae LMG 941]
MHRVAWICAPATYESEVYVLYAQGRVRAARPLFAMQATRQSVLRRCAAVQTRRIMRRRRRTQTEIRTRAMAVLGV